MRGEIELGLESEMTTHIKKYGYPFMVFIYLREVISIIGIILHELAHYIMCILLNVNIISLKIYPKVSDTKIQFGAFEYTYVDSFWKNVAINYAPLVFNTVIGSILVIFTVNTLIPQTILQGIYYFIILSILAKSFPSLADINNIKKYNSEQIGISYILVVYPLEKIANLSIFMVDYIIAGLFFIGLVMII